jgi:tRNA dimethylallyltransferase
MSNNSKNKIIAVLGTTASGKTGLAVRLAHKFGGEIVSADSRQVYKYMDVGSGKDLVEYSLKVKNRDSKFKTVRIPYHCIDVVDPKTEYNLAKFYRDASRAIGDICERGKLPIIAGGTGLYAQAIIDGFELSSSKPDKEKRKKLENKSVEELLSIYLWFFNKFCG